MFDEEDDRLQMANNKSLSFSYKSDYVNEVFIHFYMKLLEGNDVVKKNNIHGVAKGNLDSLITLIRSNEKNKTKGLELLVVFFLYIFSFVIALVSSVLIGLYICLFLGKKTAFSSDRNSSVGIVRSPASMGKIEKSALSNGVVLYSDKLLKDNVGEYGNSIHCIPDKISKFLSVFIIPAISLRDYIYVTYDATKLLGVIRAGYVLYYYSMRIAHKSSYEYSFNYILKQGIGTYYTGNKEDRFAVLEGRLCKAYEVPVVCIPHGIEYAFMVPAGLVGDEFYCTTGNAAHHLSLLYKSDSRFIFDEEIASSMFCKNEVVKAAESIVFFPESREPEINLLIMQAVIGLGFSLTVKLHPLDTEKNYCSIASQVTFTDDFDFAISNHICLARKSTVLVEAIYNNSIPIAVLIDKRDRFFVEKMLPSLADDKIRKVLSYKELEITLKELGAQRLN